MVSVYLAAGGVIGTFARFGLSGWVQSGVQRGFPWGTLSANVLGSLLLGLTMGSLELIPVSPQMRALLTVGFCGAFTTFSTFSFEVVLLLQRGDWARAGVYAAGSLGLGLLGVLSGLMLARFLVRIFG